MNSSFLSTRAEFEKCLLHFYNETKTCSSESGQWTLETKTILRHSFLKRNSVILPKSTRKTTFVTDENDITINEEPDLTSIVNTSIEMIDIEHHIIYSTSYQVPVLYFKTHYQDGTPLLLNEIHQQIVPDMYHDQVIISQAEHPILSTPFWYIHPCDTRKLMNTVEFEHLNYIKTWLSFNGPIVKCQISKELFK